MPELKINNTIYSILSLLKKTPMTTLELIETEELKDIPEYNIRVIVKELYSQAYLEFRNDKYRAFIASPQRFLRTIKAQEHKALNESNEKK